MYTDNSGYGWSAVLNEPFEALRFWSKEDEQQHITYKEPKAVRHAVESFLPQRAGRNVLLHEDNHTVCHIPTCMTSRSPVMMDELRRLWCLLDTNILIIRARCIKSTTNVWADKLSRHLDIDDYGIVSVLFANST
jgi:hypothetical protein